jgi:hypothetical protein
LPGNRDDSHGSFCNWPGNAHVADDLADELVHGPLVRLAPPARPKHIAHYVGPYKASPAVGGNVLQIDNACAGHAQLRTVLLQQARALPERTLLLTGVSKL